MTGADICRSAMQDAMVLGAGEPGDANDIADVLDKANRIVDNWNADDLTAFEERFDQFTLTPLLSPHTIGPTGTFAATVRPLSIEAANIVDTTVTPNVKVPITVRRYDWYARQPVPGVQVSFPSDLYYQPDFPNGALYLFGVPTVAYKLELWTRSAFTALTLTGTVSLAPGYRDALTLTIAENICPMFGQLASPDLKDQAAKARARAFASFQQVPNLATRDAGMPNGGASRNTFRWDIGQSSR